MTATRRSHYSISTSRRSSRAQAGRSAHVRAARRVESQPMIRGSSYAYSPAPPNAAGSPFVTSQPQEPPREEIRAIERSVDSKRPTEPAGTPAEIEGPLHFSSPGHEREPFDGLEGAHQYARSFSSRFARQIEAKRRAINLIHIRVMRRPKKRRIAQALTRKGMTGGIVRKIGFRFDDAARRDSFLAIAHENTTQQCLCQGFRLDRQNARVEARKIHAARFSATSARALCISSSVVPQRISKSSSEFSAQRRRTYGSTSVSGRSDLVETSSTN